MSVVCARKYEDKIILATINEFGRYDNLKATLDIDKAKAYFSKIEGKPISTFSARTKFDTLTHKFIIEGCFELK